MCNNIVICVHKMCFSTSNQAEMLSSQLKPHCSYSADQDLVFSSTTAQSGSYSILLHF